MNKKTAVTIGKFDGLHLGHAKIIKTMKEISDKYNFQPVVFSFCPAPAEYLTGEKTKGIYTGDEKTILLTEMGIEKEIKYPFAEIKNMPPDEFIEEILIKKFNCGAVIIGAGFRFGRDKSGDARTLAEICNRRGLFFNETEPVEKCGRVSSSRIKGLLATGEIKKANELLGRPYFISGAVERGKRLGREIGFPTANITTPNDKFLPRFGVYKTTVVYEGEKHSCVTNLGLNPTVSGETIKCETHIPGFGGEIYGELIRVDFHDFIRGESRFDSLEDLKRQIKNDVESVSS